MTALINTGQIATLMHTRPGYVADSLMKRPDFPKPLAMKSRHNQVWRRSDVLQWMMPGKDIGEFMTADLPTTAEDAEAVRLLASKTMHAHLLALVRNAKKRCARKSGTYDLPDGAAADLFRSQAGKCAVSGMSFTLEKFGGTSAPFAPSLDRIKNGEGYKPANVRLVCCAVNYLMNHWGDEVYHALAKHIREQSC